MKPFFKSKFFFVLVVLLYLSHAALADTWRHIIDDPWAGFNGSLTYVVTSQRSRPVIADVDGDSYNDVVVGTYSGVVIIYWNNGDGTFVEDRSALLAFDDGSFSVPVVADINQDGVNDIVIGASEGTVTLFLNNDDRTFTESSALSSINVVNYAVPFCADIDADGFVDILVGASDGQVRLFINDGTGSSFVADTTVLGSMAVDSDSSPVVADVTGDDLPDILVGSGYGTVHLFSGNDLGAFDDMGVLSDDEGYEIDVEDYSTPFVADLNGDDAQDLLVGWDDGTTELYMNNGDGTFARDTSFFGPHDFGSTAAPTVGDLNSDGAPDIVVGAFDGTLSVFWNDGSGYFGESPTTYAGIDAGDYSVPTAADLDENGYRDILVGANDGTLTLYWNQGDGTFLYDTIQFASVDVGDSSFPVTADIDGDGDLDILLGAADGSVTYLESSGGSFSILSALRADGSPISVGSNSVPAIADIDGDGDNDLVVGSYANGLALFKNNGAGTFTSSSAFSSMSFGMGAVPEVGDFNGDGLADVIVGTESGNVYFAQQKVDHSFLSPVLLESGGVPIVVDRNAVPRLMDINRDDINDLIVSSADGALTLYMNDGTGVLTHDAETFSTINVGGYANVSIQDINGDAKSDILIGGLSGRVFLLTTDYDDDGRVGLLDCNNFDPTIYVTAPEICDGKDNDCDDAVDEDLPTSVYYADADGDGYGVDSVTTTNCRVPTGYSVYSTDCDDMSGEVYPSHPEICDGIDNNCNDSVDDDCVSASDIDDDGDGYSENEGDCDDNTEGVFPGADELCDEIDNNCDGVTDEGCLTDPVDPADPVDPTDPTDPADPSDPGTTDPADPADPGSSPTKPSAPTSGRADNYGMPSAGCSLKSF